MEKVHALVLAVAIIAGSGIAASLFILYPETMLAGTSLDSGSSSGEFTQPYMDENGDALGGAPQVPTP